MVKRITGSELDYLLNPIPYLASRRPLLKLCSLRYNHTYIQVIFVISILLCMPNSPWVLVAESSIFVSADHRTRFQSKFQKRLFNSRCLRIWGDDRKDFSNFRINLNAAFALPKIFFMCFGARMGKQTFRCLLLWRWRLMVVLEPWWTQFPFLQLWSLWIFLAPLSSSSLCMGAK